MIIFLRSYSITKDSRLLKYIYLCKARGISYKVIGWDKDNTEYDSSEYIYFRSDFVIGGQWKNLFSIFKWWCFIFSNIKKIASNKKINTIHSVDLDCGIIGIITAKIIGAKHLYDIYDVFSANRNMQGYIKNIVNAIERFICRHSSYFIMPEKFRFKQLGIPCNDKKYNNFVEIENVPNITLNNKIEQLSDINRIHFVYAGSLEAKHRGIENLLEAVSTNPDVTLDIAGIGPLTSLCESYASKFSNIKFYGGISPQQVYELESKSTIIVGMYYKTRDNHFFASPNKYYEHLALGKVMLTTKGTPHGFKVEKYQTGFAIDETIEDINNIIQYMRDNKDVLAQYAKNARKVWLDSYKDYNAMYFSKQYIKMVG
ncbi:glycosyltransferase [Salmonella enterica]|nr:glycosyltransferase [Salmonella enterica]